MEPCLTCCWVTLLQLDVEEVVQQYTRSRRRLLVLGYNATLTTAVEAPRQPKRHFDQIRARCPPVLRSSLPQEGRDTGFVAFSAAA